MRRLVVLALAVGCSHEPSHPSNPDAPTAPSIDADPAQCTAVSGTANVLFDDSGTATTFARLDAGGTWFTGPVAPATDPPMSLTLIVTNTDPLPQGAIGCCFGGGGDCCTIAGIVITTDGLPSGGELGSHPAKFQVLGPSTSPLDGTIDITAFEQPFTHAPGRIAGSVSAISNTRTITGSIDDAFCAAMLSATI
jgi:hypothetical protein